MNINQKITKEEVDAKLRIIDLIIDRSVDVTLKVMLLELKLKLNMLLPELESITDLLEKSQNIGILIGWKGSSEGHNFECNTEDLYKDSKILEYFNKE